MESWFLRICKKHEKIEINVFENLQNLLKKCSEMKGSAGPATLPALLNNFFWTRPKWAFDIWRDRMILTRWFLRFGCRCRKSPNVKTSQIKLITFFWHKTNNCDMFAGDLKSLFTRTHHLRSELKRRESFGIVLQTFRNSCK